MYVFPEMKLHGLIISKTEFCLSISTFMSLWAIYIYEDQSAYFTAAKYCRQTDPANL
jgi:hypothetical protein